MNDRFKFRYYDKNTKNMYKLKPITNTGENGKDIRFYGILISGIGQLSECECDCQENLIKMQCTGLKDKNGKLIYEGDIVKDQDGKIYNIKWNDCYAYFVLWDSDDIEYYTFEEFNLTKLEVIGNIYENPELLGCKNE